METIRVNMTPCEDIKTIHASQNDNEAREWGFELHNNGEKIDSSSISDQMVFKAYEGGTEQILPENTSTPTTSPFLGDIKYPQGLLSDQEFLYRESPTEEDGLAKITDIKGNTLVWNQLVQNGNFGSTNGWTPTSTTTFTVSGNVGSVTWSGTGTYARIQQGIPRYANHKYLAICDIKLSNANDDVTPISMYNGTELVNSVKADSVNWKTYFLLFTQLSDSDSTVSRTRFCQMGNASTAEIRNAMLFDLTAMGLDISNPSDFTSLFSLPYYAYNQGTLLSFMGNGIKTTGVNLFNINNYRSMDSAWTLTDDVLESNNNSYKNYVSETIVGTGNRYTLSFKYNVSQNRTYAIQIYNRTDNVQLRRFEFQSALTSYSLTDVLESGKEYDIRIFGYSATSGTVRLYDIQLQLGDTATAYVGYIEPSTANLPISIYFPTGMKSAGTVYDELTPTKGITRIGAVDLGSLTWSYNEQYQCFTTYPVLTDSADVNTTSVPNFTSIYKAVSWSVGATDATQDMATCFLSSAHQLRVRNKSFTDPTAFKTAMNGVYLYYELATESETSFTTASLVTENAEIPLSNEDGVLIGKCTEQLSENPGFFDAKIKLSDEDGECYSNKIQLHVERSPQ